ncbi:hypothetical protein NP233_g3561 [Leucocoprinus birnbaumii]|uniref:Uncharacterized protein n=1 Tax=Leucocoprinus birnbaumii TaxID=56174 RepID=A0AAD5YSQ6_9AGAR|nr:hypothetical protein NP233_g3561 [Leucocoprinus birnbaumii]
MLPSHDEFDTMITESNEPFGSQDFYSQFQAILHTLSKLSSKGEVKLFPLLFVIDDLEPMIGEESSEEFTLLLQALYSASTATTAPTPVSSSSTLDLQSNISTTSTSFNRAVILRESLGFPPFLRILVLSRSLGDKPSLIEKFAFIRDGHHSSNGKPNKLHSSATKARNNASNNREEISLDYAPLNTIAEANSQGSFI